MDRGSPVPTTCTPQSLISLPGLAAPYCTVSGVDSPGEDNSSRPQSEGHNDIDEALNVLLGDGVARSVGELAAVIMGEGTEWMLEEEDMFDAQRVIEARVREHVRSGAYCLVRDSRGSPEGVVVKLLHTAG